MEMNRVFASFFLIYKLLYNLISGLHVSYDLNSITNCADDKYVFLKIIQISLDQCVMECVRRTECLALNYRRRFTLCNLLDTGGLSELEWASKDKDCALVNKLIDMHFALPTGCQDCKVGENCDFENGTCTITECPKLSLENGNLHGTMNSVGNRVKIICNQGYETETGEVYSTCTESGNWTIIPKCVKVGIGLEFNTAGAWIAAGPGTTTETSCRNVRRDGCRKHYRHQIIDDWTSLNPQLMRYSLYKNDVEVVWVMFNATGSTKTDWFKQKRILSSSYTDLSSTCKCNFVEFTYPITFGRVFYASLSWGGCKNDDLWFATFDNKTGTCYYDQYSKWPYIWYSKLKMKANTGNPNDFDFADFSIVTVVA